MNPLTATTSAAAGDAEAPAPGAPPVRAARASADDSMIPLFDLCLTDADLDAVAQTLRAGSLVMGPRTTAFEHAFARHLGVRHVVALSSATAALHLSYLAAGVGPGDEVIVPSYTFAATAAAAVYCGARPVFADIVSDADLSIDPDEVERLIGPRTRAVVAVHFGGYAAPVDRLADICARHGVALIEDAAHAPSADLGGRALGTFGLASAFSLFSNKVLSVGEGGMLATDDDRVAALARELRSPRLTPGAWEGGTLSEAGGPFNYRIDEPRSALALSRLARLRSEVRVRQEHSRRYRDALADLEAVTVPYSDADVAHSSCYVMPVVLRDPARRDAVRIALREAHGVQTSVLYPPVHRFSAYVARFGHRALARTERVAAGEITLPLFTTLTESQQQRVVDALRTELS